MMPFVVIPDAGPLPDVSQNGTAPVSDLTRIADALEKVVALLEEFAPLLRVASKHGAMGWALKREQKRG